ncbi:beta-glucosidase [Frondihabitans australicus]|uniref:Exo-alpha-(1->6)-L-arabinopyranosidase n=2 Tax=Frondihabitans australicus TaxID=386892 RepID=A0A495IBQ9_9MICO|nr:beta-glucosidase [Frondihabitans australicus]
MKYESTPSPRVEKLLEAMSIDEKVGQLTQFFFFDLPDDAPAIDLPGESGDGAAMTAGVEQALDHGTVGSLLFVTDPAATNRLQRRALEGNRHGIPLIFGFDVIHGLRTIFPVPIALAASWDPALAERAQTVAAREARAVGIHWAFAPMVDIARDARWGRMIEGAGEDPVLGAAMAAGQVRGFQGAGDESAPAVTTGARDRILAGPKHFAGYGGAVGGRDYDEVDLSDQDFWNTYVQPFRGAIQAGATNIMSAYMDLNGVPATGNRWLLTDVLRDELGFDGFVVSDANSAKDLATHHYADGAPDAAARAIEAGLDMEMAISEPSFATLGDAVRSGRIPEARIDESVRRILRLKEELGLLDDPFVDEQRAAEVLSDPAHRTESREVAERTAVLLKNDGGLLPLDPAATPKIAVIGPLASSRRDVIGPWVFDFDLDETVSVLEGIEAFVQRAGDQGAGAAEISFARGCAEPKRLFPSMFEMFGDNSPSAPEGFDAAAALDEAVALATASDVAIVVVGEQQDMIGENASRSSLELPGEQQAMLEAVAATGTPVVVVVMNGRPLDLRWAASNVPAILDVWYPGTKGGEAVANLLFGAATPAGKLPFSWPRTVGQIPMTYSRTRSHDPEKQGRRYWDDESTPLFPFGHGLSYTSFSYSAASVSADSIDLDGTVTVSVEVTNTGRVAGAEVAQMYLHQRSGTSSRPLRLLKGFRRIELAPGETASVQFEVGPAERRYWSAATRDWVLDATTFDVWVGGSSDASQHAEFRVTE